MAPNKFDWQAPAWLKNPKQETVIFHDAEVEAYRGMVAIENIRLWRDNDRTLLDLEHIEKELGKDCSRLSDDEIIDYILRQGLHKIPDLAKSIKENGVRVPVVLTHNKELLDGNRRFLACKFLMKREKEQKETFIHVPAYCLRPRISEGLRLKIIAEMNFLSDFKLQWPREVRANFVVDLYKRFKKELGEEEALKKIGYELDVNKSDVLRFQKVLAMITAYVGRQKTAAKCQEAEIFGRDKFHFFEEFYNKALAKKDPKHDAALIEEDSRIFYQYLEKDELNSTTRVRDFAFMLGTTQSKKVLKSSAGNYEDAWAVYEDVILSKKATSKFERFCKWLESLTQAERKEMPSFLIKRLLNLLNKF